MKAIGILKNENLDLEFCGNHFWAMCGIISSGPVDDSLINWLIQVVVKWSLWNFAPGMTAVLLWHLQTFIAIWYLLYNKITLNQFSIKFELRWKNREMVPICAPDHIAPNPGDWSWQLSHTQWVMCEFS